MWPGFVDKGGDTVQPISLGTMLQNCVVPQFNEGRKAQADFGYCSTVARNRCDGGYLLSVAV